MPKKKMNVYLPEQFAEWLEEYERKTGISKSDTMRAAIWLYANAKDEEQMWATMTSVAPDLILPDPGKSYEERLRQFEAVLRQGRLSGPAAEGMIFPKEAAAELEAAGNAALKKKRGGKRRGVRKLKGKGQSG